MGVIDNQPLETNCLSFIFNISSALIFWDEINEKKQTEWKDRNNTSEK